jgi:hypothetical protein
MAKSGNSKVLSAVTGDSGPVAGLDRELSVQAAPAVLAVGVLVGTIPPAWLPGCSVPPSQARSERHKPGRPLE